jgi:ribosomal protein S18 acetylase RimI-like enzyme
MDFELINKLQEFHFNGQLNLYLSTREHYDKFDLFLSDCIEDSHWNFASCLKVDSQKEFMEAWEQIKSIMARKKRVPAVYITPLSSAYQYKDKIVSDNFKIIYSDIWMMLENVSCLAKYKSKFDIVITEVGEKDKEKFVDTIMEGFRTDDPNEPYGDMGDYYKDVLLKSFENSNKEYIIKHFMAQHNGIPTSTATVIVKDDIACLYNVATIKKYKNNGICKELMSDIFDRLLQSKISTIFLQTEKGSYVEEFYKKLGFKPAFEGICYAGKIRGET